MFCVQRKDDFQSVVMEHLRMNGAYWGLTALDILGKLNIVDADEVVSWVMSCQHESGKFSKKFTALVCAYGCMFVLNKVAIQLHYTLSA